MVDTMSIDMDEFGLFTDLYELTMAQSYFENDMNRPATFSLLIRTYPPHRNFFVAAGLATVLEYLQHVHFSSAALAGKRYGIPTAGTMAHSYITSFTDEGEAFRAYARSFPQQTYI